MTVQQNQGLPTQNPQDRVCVEQPTYYGPTPSASLGWVCIDGPVGVPVPRAQISQAILASTEPVVQMLLGHYNLGVDTVSGARETFLQGHAGRSGVIRAEEDTICGALGTAKRFRRRLSCFECFRCTMCRYPPCGIQQSP